jgi:Spy/CpxP family protein refolding chaperone
MDAGRKLMKAFRVKYSSIVVAMALTAGAAIGFTGSRFAYRALLRLRPQQGLQVMAHELRLTDAQEEQVRAVMGETRGGVAAARKEYQVKRRRLMVEAYEKIHVILTPEQQALLDRKFVSPRLLAAVRANAAAVSPAPPAPAKPVSVATSGLKGRSDE